MPFRPGVKCFLFAWIPAWAAGLGLASALIAGMEFVTQAADCGLGCTLAVVDAIPVQAKLAYGGLLGGLMGLSRLRRPQSLRALMLLDAASGLAAAFLVILAFPAGFGLFFLDVTDFPAPNSLYGIGAALGGALATLLERSCLRKLTDR